MGRTYDEEPLAEAKTEDMDLRVASELFVPPRPITESVLRTLHLVTVYQGRTVPTVGGILLFGADRLRFFPDAWIQCGRFAGRDRGRIRDCEYETGLRRLYLLPAKLNRSCVTSLPRTR